ncbi:MAG: sulfurtransferase [Methylobacteriaceae bacterium]|nr:sulfurtransferase [Methylobacteriaceae bacterium]
MARLDALEPEERRDLGVPPTPELRGGSPEAPTPNQIPGGQVITTKGLYSLIQGAAGTFVLLDILGGPTTLPGAVPALPARAPGNFQDQTQQQLSQYLSQLTRGNPQVPLVFYCLGVNCWQSYNAALRAIHLGYRNVLWYRGGLEAWSKAGLPTQPQQQSPKPSP